MRSHTFPALFCLAVTIAVVPPARAQMCLGEHGFRSFGAHVTGLVVIAGEASAVRDDAGGFGGGFSVGRTDARGRGTFGSLHVGRVTSEEVDDVEDAGGSVDPEYSGEVAFGWQLPAKGRVMSICPTVALRYFAGPELAFPFDGVEGGEVRISPQGWTAYAGAWVGGPLAASSAIEIIPAIGFHFAQMWGDVDVQGGDVFNPGGEPIDDSLSETFGRFSVAAGLGFGERWLVRPRVEVPIGLEGAGTSYILGVSYSLDRRVR